MKAVLYFVAAIFVGVCIYAFVEGVSVIIEENPQQLVQEANQERGGTTEKSLEYAIDKNTSEPCEKSSFWAKYDIWGDTDTVYAPAENDEIAEKKVDESIGCDDPGEDAVSR